MRLSARSAPRAGLSLLEVLAALAIFLMSFVAIGKLVSVATDHSLEVQMQSQATQMAQSKLNEVVSGALPLSSQSGTVDEDPEWQWSIDAEQNGDVGGLWTVKVRVWRQVDNRDIASTLSQMVLDPSVRGSMFDQVVVTGSQDTASSNSSNSSNSNNSSSSGQQSDQSDQSATGGAMAGGTPAKPGAKTGGNTGARSGGNAGGNTGGRSGGNTGGRSGGNTGGNSTGNMGGNSGGRSGGNSAPASGGGRSGGSSAPASGGGRSGGGSGGAGR